jgi:hypothetical protein
MPTPLSLGKRPNGTFNQPELEQRFAAEPMNAKLLAGVPTDDRPENTL